MTTRLITLISDYDQADPFLAQVKGVLALDGVVHSVDLMHGLMGMSPEQVAFRWRRAWQHFPVGSIHLALQQFAEPAAIWVVTCLGQRLCGFTQSMLVRALPPGTAYELRQYQLPAKWLPTFAARDALAPLGAALAMGDDCLGQLLQVSHDQSPQGPSWEAGTSVGTVCDIDGFGNIISDIQHPGQQEALAFIQLRRQRIPWNHCGNQGQRGYPGLAGPDVMLSPDPTAQPAVRRAYGVAMATWKSAVTRTLPQFACGRKLAMRWWLDLRNNPRP